MVSRLYAIYDRVAEEFGPVFEAKTDGVAVRGFSDIFAKSLHGPITEYDLCFLGETFDHGSGFFAKVGDGTGYNVDLSAATPTVRTVDGVSSADLRKPQAQVERENRAKVER